MDEQSRSCAPVMEMYSRHHRSSVVVAIVFSTETLVCGCGQVEMGSCNHLPVVVEAQSLCGAAVAAIFFPSAMETLVCGCGSVEKASCSRPLVMVVVEAPSLGDAVVAVIFSGAMANLAGGEEVHDRAAVVEAQSHYGAVVVAVIFDAMANWAYGEEVYDRVAVVQAQSHHGAMVVVVVIFSGATASVALGIDGRYEVVLWSRRGCGQELGVIVVVAHWN